MYGDAFGGEIEVLIGIVVIVVILIIFGGWLFSSFSREFDEGALKAQIEKCELELKRNETCKLIAVPDR